MTPTPPATKDSIKGNKKDKHLSTQLYLKVTEIRDDTAILKNGGLRAILKTSSVNLNLKSEQEQNAVIYSYQNFLNSLEFPIQIVVRSKKLDLEHYIEKLKKIGVKQINPLLQKQTFEYIEYVSRLVEYADIMEKQFYVVIPQDPFGEERRGFLKSFLEMIFPGDNVAKIQKRHAQFEELKKRLNQRVNTVRAGLESCGLRVDLLDTQELIELFYETYNPQTSRSQRVEPEQEFALEQDEKPEAPISVEVPKTA